MANFTGTVTDFNKFLGGYQRNTIQTISKKHKKKVGKCEHCGSRTKYLDAAHKTGKERHNIVSNILQDYNEDGIINIDLITFEERYLMSHEPIEDVIFVLCKKCHLEYDMKGNKKTKKVSEDQQIEELLKANKFSKKQAIQKLNELGYNKIQNENTIFSNINKTKNVYWLEPNNEKFNDSFFIILYDCFKNRLNILLIEEGQVQDPKSLFEQRNDRNSSKLIIDYSESSFIDKRGYDFTRFLIGTIDEKE